MTGCMYLRNLFSLLIFCSSLSFLSCEENLKDDRSRFSYAVGQQVGLSLKNQRMDDYVDVDALSKGIVDALQGKGKLTPQEIRQAMIKAQSRETPESAAYKKKNEEYLEKNKSKEGIQATSSGLQYQIIKAGFGKKPRATDNVKVHYRGQLIDGKEFDSSYKRGQPAQFPVNGVIKGWQEALRLMPVGSKWKLFIPAAIAYGPGGNSSIPGHSTLIFDIELLAITGSR